MRDFIETLLGILSVIGTLLLLGGAWVGIAYVLGIFFGLASRGFNLVA